MCCMYTAVKGYFAKLLYSVVFSTIDFDSSPPLYLALDRPQAGIDAFSIFHILQHALPLCTRFDVGYLTDFFSKN